MDILYGDSKQYITRQHDQKVILFFTFIFIFYQKPKCNSLEVFMVYNIQFFTVSNTHVVRIYTTGGDRPPAFTAPVSYLFFFSVGTLSLPAM